MAKAVVGSGFMVEEGRIEECAVECDAIQAYAIRLHECAYSWEFPVCNLKVVACF